MTGEPILALDYDPDLSHALLVSVVMKLGGSVELDLTDLSPDSIGDQAGGLYALALDPIGAHRLRLSVISRQHADEKGDSCGRRSQEDPDLVDSS